MAADVDATAAITTAAAVVADDKAQYDKRAAAIQLLFFIKMFS